MTEVPFRWGICGTGAIANGFVEAFARVPDGEVVAVASRTPSRADEFTATHGLARAHHGYDALAADPDVDVVYVATTQERHIVDAVTYLDAGKHVLCEKPFAMTADDARAMFEAAARNDRFLMEALWTRFSPAYAVLRELLESGRIGRPQMVEANFSMRIPPERATGHRLFDPDRGGGALLDLGIYPLQLAELVFGPPDRVGAVAALTPEGVDGMTAIVLGYETGAAALLHTAITVNGDWSARITGEEGAIDLAPPMHATNRLTVHDSHGDEVIDTEDPSLHFQVLHVHECLRSGLTESPVMPASETISLLTTADEIRARSRPPRGTSAGRASPEDRTGGG